MVTTENTNMLGAALFNKTDILVNRIQLYRHTNVSPSAFGAGIGSMKTPADPVKFRPFQMYMEWLRFELC